MKALIIDSIMKNISNNYNYDKVKLSEIRYGLETLYLTITKTIVVIIISLIIGTIKELLWFMLFYGIRKALNCCRMKTEKRLFPKDTVITEPEKNRYA